MLHFISVRDNGRRRYLRFQSLAEPRAELVESIGAATRCQDLRVALDAGNLYQAANGGDVWVESFERTSETQCRPSLASVLRG